MTVDGGIAPPRTRAAARVAAREAATLRTGPVWAAGAAFGVAGVNYAFSLGLAYALDVGDYAVFAAAQALLVVAGTVAASAAPWLLAAQVAVHRGSTPDDVAARRRAVGFACALNLTAGAGGTVVVGLAASAFAGPAVTALLAGTTLLTFLASTAVGYLQGYGRFRGIAAYRVAEAGTKVLVGTLGVAAGLGVAAAVGGFAAAAAAMCALGAWTMRSDLSGALTHARDGLRDATLWRVVAGLGGVQGLVAVLTNLDTVAVAVLPLDRTGAATYQVAAILGRLPVFLSTAVSMVAFRSISAGTVRTPQVVSRSLRLYGPGAVVLAALAGTAPAAVTAAVLPARYAGVGSLLALTATAGALLGVVNLLSTFFQAERRFARAVVPLAVSIAAQAAGIAAGSRYGVTAVAWGSLAGVAAGAVMLALATRRQWWPGLPVTATRRLPRLLAAAFAVALGVAVLAFAAVQPLVWCAAAAVLVAATGWAQVRSR